MILSSRNLYQYLQSVRFQTDFSDFSSRRAAASNAASTPSGEGDRVNRLTNGVTSKLYAIVMTPMAGGNSTAAVAGTVFETIYRINVMHSVPIIETYAAVLLARR